MFKKVVTIKQDVTYKFHVNDPVLCTVENEIKNAIVLSRYIVKGENYYKIGNNTNTKTFKESVLIHR
jgi:hypothetical protein